MSLLFEICLNTIAVGSLLLQLYLFFLIWRAGMAAYRYFLTLQTVWDVLFGVALAFGLDPLILFPAPGLFQAVRHAGGLCRGRRYIFRDVRRAVKKG